MMFYVQLLVNLLVFCKILINGKFFVNGFKSNLFKYVYFVIEFKKKSEEG